MWWCLISIARDSGRRDNIYFASDAVSWFQSGQSVGVLQGKGELGELRGPEWSLDSAVPTATLLHFRPSASGKTRHDNQDQTNRKKIHPSCDHPHSHQPRRRRPTTTTTFHASRRHPANSHYPAQTTHTPQTATMVQLTEVEDEHFQHAKAEDFEDDEDFSDTGTPLPSPNPCSPPAPPPPSPSPPPKPPTLTPLATRLRNLHRLKLRPPLRVPVRPPRRPPRHRPAHDSRLGRRQGRRVHVGGQGDAAVRGARRVGGECFGAIGRRAVCAGVWRGSELDGDGAGGADEADGRGDVDCPWWCGGGGGEGGGGGGAWGGEGGGGG